MYGLYNRLRVHVSATDTAVIRAVRRKFKRKVRRDPKHRETRKSIYRSMLKEHHDYQALVTQFRL